MPGDPLVRTYASKQVAFDKNLISDATQGEADWYAVCFTPTERWFMLTLLEFYTTFKSRFVGGWTEREIDQLHADTLKRMICPMACSDQFEQLLVIMTGMAITLQEISDKVGPTGADINLRLLDIDETLDEIKVSVDNSFPSSIFDQLEPIMDAVNIILGGVGILPP